MKKMIIDRYEGKYAVCEDKDKAFFAIELSELPSGAKVGDVIAISDEGVLTLDEEETARRRQRIEDKQKKLLGI